MIANKENFVKEYKYLCMKYGLMLEPDDISALTLEKFDDKQFEDRFKETRNIEEYFEKKRVKILDFWR